MDTRKLILLLLLAWASGMPALLAQLGGRALPALCVTLNPGDCLNCTQAVHLLQSEWLRGVPRAVIVREDLSPNERQTLIRSLGCDTDSTLVVLADDSLYARLNRTARSFFHVLAPDGRPLYGNLLPSIAAYGDRTLASLLYAQPRHETAPLPPALELLGPSRIQAVGDTLHLYSYALNRWYSWTLSDPEIQVHRFDQPETWRAPYTAWTGDTTGFARYVADAQHTKRVLGMPPLQIEQLGAEPPRQPAQLLKMYFPKRVRNPTDKRSYDTHWVPEHLVVLRVGGRLDTVPLRPWTYERGSREFWPHQLIHQQGDRLYLFAEEDSLRADSPYHVEYEIQPTGRLKPVRVKPPRLPQAVQGSGPKSSMAHASALFFEQGWVYRFAARTWTQLPAPAPDLRLADARYDRGFFHGLYRTAADSLVLALWTAEGQLAGSWPLGASVARARSNVWLTGRYVYWIDHQDRLHRLALRHPRLEATASP